MTKVARNIKLVTQSHSELMIEEATTHSETRIMIGRVLDAGIILSSRVLATLNFISLQLKSPLSSGNH